MVPKPRFKLLKAAAILAGFDLGSEVEHVEIASVLTSRCARERDAAGRDTGIQVQMDPGMYQNGALWDWWAGRQISAEFWSGYWHLARDHLFMVSRDWATHPGQVREWENVTSNCMKIENWIGGEGICWHANRDPLPQSNFP